MNGLFISFEGSDGAGKSSMLAQLVPIVKAHTDRPVVLTREPGGSPIAEQIRHLILDPANKEMSAATEALLYAAARAQHLQDVIRPALADGAIVLSDRYVDSSIAYQGGGRQLGTAAVAAINQFATAGTMPALTLYVDVPPAVGMARIQKYRERAEDRLEKTGDDFRERVHQTYQDLVQAAPERIVRLDGTQSIDQLTAAAWQTLRQRFSTYLTI
ncbi:dTMP kinase [Schleiferilactobacillus shenzhenensis]|uniref:Thymidylate kinase n=1 Tax=Schleiferilactobacillus shenzhenensis LY-73 TaxID=1231336 RepID=U4TQ30_9LACO|nr:dTMP kinase [Schleiferilactobacillus shenzhenensis]ERL66304.1 Tmk [Schleiferilactobacillus shenzhenensis LY-73]